MLRLLVRGALFFVYAAQFLRPSSKVTVLSSPPLNRAEHLLIHRIQSHTNPKRRKGFLKQAGQKSSKEELPKQRKGPKRAEKCWLKVQTHIWEQDAGSSSLPTRTKTPQNLLILRSFSLFLLQNDQNAFKHFPAEKLAYSKAVKACLMTGFPPYFLLHALRLKQSMSRITCFESSEFKAGYLCI